MIGKRQLTISDYAAMARRWASVLVIPAAIAALAAFLLSYSFTPQYTSQTVMLVHGQTVPEGFVKPGLTQELSQRVANIEAQVLSRNRLQAIAERYGLLGEQSAGEVLTEMRKKIVVSPVQTDFTPPSRGGKPAPITSFSISYTGSNPATAQKVCNDLASLFVEQDLRGRQAAAQGTTEFLTGQLRETRQALDEQDAKVAAFKKRYIGQLPGQQENNLKILAGLSTELDAVTQTLNRAQQDKAYSESVLAQAVQDWKASQSTADPKALQQQLHTLEAQLLSLRARYTDEFPEVIKTKHNIAELEQRIKEASSSENSATAKPYAAEPLEIQKLRAEIHQHEQTLAQSTRQQAEIQNRIRVYQSRVELSPEIEEEYKKLTRDYDTLQKFYTELLGKQSESAMTTDMERRQQGEQIRVLDPATFPADPTFPNRGQFAGAGLGAGLLLGVVIALAFELRDTAIRNELDVEASLALPTLVLIPRVSSENGFKRADDRNGRGRPDKELKDQANAVRL